MNPVVESEKSEAGPLATDTPVDAPPAYTPHPPSSASGSATQVNDERNPASIPSTMGEKKVYTTYHVYLEQNYMRKLKVATVKHLNSEEPNYRFEFPEEGKHAGQMVMLADKSASPAHLGIAIFTKDFGNGTLNLSDGRIANISVVKRTTTRQENATPEQHPSTLFWEMGSHNHGASRSGFGNLELMDEDRKVYAVLLTAFHKSMKKLGRLHFMVKPNDALVEMAIGSLMSIWKKAERDVRSGHIGLRT
ncbi:hypothetical protein N0V90_006197 [Kalmusia sp. IMI 367209]|nr:hypothetical protein N0V90_006197 [Kalmusia sp. IMI 367209]